MVSRINFAFSGRSISFYYHLDQFGRKSGIQMHCGLDANPQGGGHRWCTKPSNASIQLVIPTKWLLSASLPVDCALADEHLAVDLHIRPTTHLICEVRSTLRTIDFMIYLWWMLDGSQLRSLSLVLLRPLQENVFRSGHCWSVCGTKVHFLPPCPHPPRLYSSNTSSPNNFHSCGIGQLGKVRQRGSDAEVDGARLISLNRWSTSLVVGSNSTANTMDGQLVIYRLLLWCFWTVRAHPTESLDPLEAKIGLMLICWM